MWVITALVILLIVLRLLLPHNEYPFKCQLCGVDIEDEDDKIFWHGFGNCVEVPEEYISH